MSLPMDTAAAVVCLVFGLFALLEWWRHWLEKRGL